MSDLPQVHALDAKLPFSWPAVAQHRKQGQVPNFFDTLSTYH